MKKFLSNFWWLIVAVIIIVVLLATNWELILNIGGGSWLKGLLMFPFFVLGIINVLRGFGANLEADEQKFKLKNDWKIGLYFLITVLGYIALIIAIQNIS